MDQQNGLRKITGLLALGFGLYCLVLVGLTLVGSTIGLPIFFLLVCLILGVAYLFYGASLLFLRKGRNLNILVLGLIFISPMLSFNFPFYMWPIFIMPIIILVLTIWMFIGQFKSRE